MQTKTFQELTNEGRVFDASGIPYPELYLWEQHGNIFFPDELNFPFKIRLKGEKHYTGNRVWLNGTEIDSVMSRKLTDHSPGGFNWGYGGSGPAQLALELVLRLTGKSNGYQDFKWKYIASLPTGDFDIELTIEQFH